MKCLHVEEKKKEEWRGGRGKSHNSVEENDKDCEGMEKY